MKTNHRLWYAGQLIVLIVSLIILYASFYFQYVIGLQPCPLCLMQRYCVMLLLLVCLMLIFSCSTKTAKFINLIRLGFAVAGLYFAGRQLWLQSFPDEHMHACLPSLDILLRYFPWQDVIHALIWGADDCSKIDWQWLGLSTPAWSAIYFCGMIIASLISHIGLQKYSVNRVV